MTDKYDELMELKDDELDRIVGGVGGSFEKKTGCTYFSRATGKGLANKCENCTYYHSGLGYEYCSNSSANEQKAVSLGPLRAR